MHLQFLFHLIRGFRINQGNCGAQFKSNDGDERVKDISNYIEKGKLWEAFASEERVVLLVDEIDKADIEFPNDLLQEIDRMEFYVYETKETIKAKNRPIVIITSNNEKELPDAFLRRCFFHYINFPDRATMEQIVAVHHPKIKKKLVKEALDIFFDVRKVPGLKKKLHPQKNPPQLIYYNLC